ncbi:hypothetical protein K2Q02_02255 [Patescibacteria group bacterium]|nr:hypothetical protein [Patescibacteria group bacterium]
MSTTMQEKLEAFLRDQAYVITDKNNVSLRCIDDRYCKDHSPHHHAVPGAGLGIIADIIAGFESATKRDATMEELQMIWDLATAHVGTPSFHTASAHVRSDISSPVLGCGYLVGTLEGEAHISAAASAFLKSKATEHAESGYEATCFDCGHDASFVLFVMNDEIGIIPTHENGTRAYVFHKPVHEKLISRIAKDVSEQFDAVSSESEVFLAAIIAAFNDRLKVVADNLNLGKFPHYEIYSLDDVRQTHHPVLQEENAEVV